MSQRQPPARLGAVDPLPARRLRELGAPQRPRAGGADGRRRAHRALLDRLGHQARPRRRDRARALHRQGQGRPRQRAARLRGGAQHRGAEDPERGAQLDRVVRARRPLRQPAARAVRLFAADAQPAHQPREPAPARQGLRRELRGLDRGGRGQAAGRAARADPADVHAVHAARHDAEEPHRRLADGAVLGGRRHPRRLPPGAPRRAGDGRRGDGRRRDDLPLARRAHHPGLPGPVEHGAARRLEADRRLRPRQQRRQDRDAARPRRRQGLDPGAVGGRGPAARSGQLAADLGLAAAVPRRHQRLVGGDDPRRHGPGARRLRPRHPLRRRGRLRLARAALRPRLPAVVVHLAAHQPAHRRVRRLAGEPPALSDRGVPGDARGLAEAAADLGADLGARLGRGRHHPGRRGRDRAPLQGRRRRPDRLLVGPGEQAAEAGLRPHVPGAVRRPHPQRGRHPDDGGGRDLRGRPRQQHHRRRPRRPLRRRPAAPRQPGVDAARIGAHRLHRGRVAEAVPLGQDPARAQPRARAADGGAGHRPLGHRAGEQGARRRP